MPRSVYAGLIARKGKPVWRPLPCSHASTLLRCLPPSDWHRELEHDVGHPTSGHARFHVARHFRATGGNAVPCESLGAKADKSTLLPRWLDACLETWQRFSNPWFLNLGRDGAFASKLRFPETCACEAVKSTFLRYSRSILNTVIARGEHNMALVMPSDNLMKGATTIPASIMPLIHSCLHTPRLLLPMLSHTGKQSSWHCSTDRCFSPNEATHTRRAAKHISLE